MNADWSRRLERAVRRLASQAPVSAVVIRRGDEVLLDFRSREPDEGAGWLDRDIGRSGATLSVQHLGAPDPVELNDAIAWCDDVLAAGADVQTLAAARDEAARQEALLRSVLMTLTDGVLLYDREMQLVECNESAVRMLGAPRIDLTRPQDGPPRAFRPDGTPLAREEWPAYRAVWGREWVNGELLDFRRRDGQRRWLLLSAAPVSAGAVVSIADLTEYYEARAASEDHLRTWQALVGALHEGVALFDVQGRVEQLNAAAEEVLGVRQADVQDAPVDPNPPPAFDERLRQVAELPYQTARRTGRTVTGVVLGIRNRRGGMRWYLNSAVPLPDGRVVASIMDFTSVKSAAEEMEQRKDEFISTLSHEMRTPLTSLAGALALLEAGLASGEPETTETLVKICARSAMRLTRLVNDVLDLERITGGAVSLSSGSHRVTDLVRHAVEAIAPAARLKGVEVVAMEPVDCMVATDPDRVAQVLGNFLSNAVQQSEAGQRVEVSATRADGFVRLAVRDDGPGVPSAFRARLFTRFAQADPSGARGGAGLGLSICKALAHALGGEVGFQPLSPRGSVFWLTLPE